MVSPPPATQAEKTGVAATRDLSPPIQNGEYFVRSWRVAQAEYAVLAERCERSSVVFLLAIPTRRSDVLHPSSISPDLQPSLIDPKSPVRRIAYCSPKEVT
ncbi:hypothetical protein J3459_002550 [Metarhizium acridum]|nr:hypothetical protein J3459_002550 [Metarhizium acridum]